MPANQRIPGCVNLGQVEVMLRKLESSIGQSTQVISGEMYWDTLKQFALSVPFTDQDKDMTPEQEDALLSRVIGMSKEKFIQSIDARLKQKAVQAAQEQAAKKKLGKKY